MTSCQVLDFFEESIKHKEQNNQEKLHLFFSDQARKENELQSYSNDNEIVQQNKSYVPKLKPKKNPSIHTSSFSLESKESSSPYKDKNKKLSGEQSLVSDKGKRTVTLKVNMSKISKKKH